MLVMTMVTAMLSSVKNIIEAIEAFKYTYRMILRQREEQITKDNSTNVENYNKDHLPQSKLCLLQYIIFLYIVVIKEKMSGVGGGG